MHGLKPNDTVEWTIEEYPSYTYTRRGVLKRVSFETSLVQTNAEGVMLIAEVETRKLKKAAEGGWYH